MFARSLFVIVATLVAMPVSAQSLGAFSWQLQPFCNVITVNVTAVAGVYTLEGADDQCGGGTRAPLTGIATPNPDGSLGFGMHLVTSPGGHGVQVEARLSLPALSGQWSDSDGNTGTFAFGQKTGGQRRPVPVTATIPAAISLRSDGGLLAAGTLDTGTIPASGAGTRMMWFPKKAAFRAGSTTGNAWDEPRVGTFSVAFGANTQASGDTSTALGKNTVASGIASLAAGFGSIADGAQSVATGFESQAQGNESVALGFRSIAMGQGAVASGYGALARGPMSLAHGYAAHAMGNNSIALGGDSGRNLGVTADGAQAVAIGSRLDAGGDGSVLLGTSALSSVTATGSFIFGDRSSATPLNIVAPNLFAVRAANGAVFYSNASTSTGVNLAPGAGAWSSLSDERSKEHFADFDDDALLSKLAALPVRTWNYKAQETSIRHAGPTAQDFYAAFGLGEDPLRISTIDADGIALAGLRALVLRQRALEAQVEAMRERLRDLERLTDRR